MMLSKLKKNISSYKRMGCLLLAAVLLGSAVSCADGEIEEPTEERTKAIADEAVTEDPRYTCSLPDDLSFEGQTVNMILPAAEVHADEFICESLGGGVVSDAVYERNLAVENMLGLDLEFYEGQVIVDVDRDIKAEPVNMSL